MTKQLVTFGLFVWAASSFAAPKSCEPNETVEVALSKETTEDGKFLIAKVHHKLRPLKGVEVDFQSPRLFGKLSHGTAITEDDGVAKINFPNEFPGEANTGNFEVTARIVNSERFFGESTVKVDGGITLQQVEDPFPREIWSSKTHWYILIVIPTLILSVWSVYVFSIGQLIRIARTKP